MDKNAEFKDRVVVITGAAGILGGGSPSILRARARSSACPTFVPTRSVVAADLGLDAAKGVVLR